MPDKQLQEVVVVSSLNKFGSRRSSDVAKMPLRNLENPQVYTSITKELLADQLVFSVDDAMRNTPGLTQEKGTSSVFPIIYKANTYSAYVSDVLNITDKLSVLAALRVDHFVHDGNYNEQTGKKTDGYNQTAFSPKFGIVYQPIKDKVALFGNYQNGFTNKPGTDYRGSSFKPEQANQLEGGVKVDQSRSWVEHHCRLWLQ